MINCAVCGYEEAEKIGPSHIGVCDACVKNEYQERFT